MLVAGVKGETPPDISCAEVAGYRVHTIGIVCIVIVPACVPWKPCKIAACSLMITQMERRFEAKECDWLERVTALEAEREGLRAEAVETRGRLRRAESSSPSAVVFERRVLVLLAPHLWFMWPLYTCTHVLWADFPRMCMRFVCQP